MLKKVRGDRLGTIQVTFELMPSVLAESAAVVGEFNGWSVEANPMERGDDGAFRTTIQLDVGRRYRFRYVIDGERWVNAWDADDYAPNDYGGDDSVVRTDDVED
jgi:1,4-alpha-glucan branching enzyme